jgi:hypothetical protein
MASFAPAGIPASSSIIILAILSAATTWSLTIGVAALDESSNVRIVRPPTTHEDLVNILTWGIALVMINDGLSGDPGSRSDYIVWRKTFRFGAANETMRQTVSEYFSSGTAISPFQSCFTYVFGGSRPKYFICKKSSTNS